MNININGSSFIKGGPGVRKQRCSAAVQSIPHLLFSQCSHFFSKLVFERSWKNVPASPGIWPPLTRGSTRTHHQHPVEVEAPGRRGSTRCNKEQGVPLTPIIHHLLVSHWEKVAQILQADDVLECFTMLVIASCNCWPRKDFFYTAESRWFFTVATMQ